MDRNEQTSEQKPDVEFKDSLPIGDPERGNKIEVTVSYWNHSDPAETPFDTEAAEHVFNTAFKETKATIDDLNLFGLPLNDDESYKPVEDIRSLTNGDVTIQVAVKVEIDGGAPTYFMAMLADSIADSTWGAMLHALDPSSVDGSLLVMKISSVLDKLGRLL